MNVSRSLSDSPKQSAQAGGRLKAWPARILPAAGAFAIAIIILMPFYSAQRQVFPRGTPGDIRVYSHHDLIEHVVMMEQFDKVLRSGTLYPRWMPDVNGGYGIAWTNFYPPGYYYLSSAIHLLISDWIDTLFIASLLVLAGSGLALYMFARLFYGWKASAFAGALYMLLPFHTLNLYWQGAMPQFTGFLFLPLVFYFAYKAGGGRRLRDVALLGLTYGSYVFTHLPVAYLTAYAVAFYAVLWAFKARDWKIVARVGAGMALGLIVASVYLLPALIESKYVFENVTEYFPYHTGYLPDPTPPDEFVSLLNDLYLLQCLALLIALLALRKYGEDAPEATSEPSPALFQTRLFMWMAIATTLMVSGLSIYVSMLIPRIEVVVFPWRWLALSSLFLSLVSAAALDRLSNSRAIVKTKRLAFMAALVAVSALGLVVSVAGVIKTALANPPIRTTTNFIESNYTPGGATLPDALPQTPPVTLSPEGGAFQVISWEPQRREVVVRVEQPTSVRLKTYNFPGWEAVVNGEQAVFSSDADGAQVIEVPAGRHTLVAEFVNTGPRAAGAALSIAGLLGIFGVVLVDGLRRFDINPVAGKRAAAKNIDSAAPIAAARPRGGGLAPGLASLLKNSYARTAIIFVATLVIVVLVMLALRGGPEQESATPGQVASGQRAGGAADRPAGSEPRLVLEGRDFVPVATDAAVLDQLMQALVARDGARIDGLIEQGKILRVANGTKVKIVESGSGRSKVRILDGEHILAEGYVAERWVR